MWAARGLERISCGPCPLAAVPGQAGLPWQNLGRASGTSFPQERADQKQLHGDQELSGTFLASLRLPALPMFPPVARAASARDWILPRHHRLSLLESGRRCQVPAPTAVPAQTAALGLVESQAQWKFLLLVDKLQAGQPLLTPSIVFKCLPFLWGLHIRVPLRTCEREMDLFG